jgi:hypothetical protein
MAQCGAVIQFNAPIRTLLHQRPPEYLQVETAGWSQKTCDMRLEWMGLSQWQRRMMIPILDAFPKGFDPLVNKNQ